MQQETPLVTAPGTWFIDSPLIAVLLFSVALAVATCLVRFVPAVRRSITVVEITRHAAIDGLRGMLGLSVFVHHTVITWFFLHGDAWQLPPSRFIVHLGQTSVALFFMITAFLFWGRVLDRGNNIDWIEFLVSRLYRLYPVYLLVLGLMTIAALLVTMSAHPALSGPILRPLLHWLGFTMFAAPDLNGLPQTGLMVAWVIWSLRYEWLFYLALPLMGFIAVRTRQPVAALLSAIALGAIFQRLHWQNTFAPGILLSFAGGIVAAHAIRRPALAAAGRTTAAGVVALAALACVIVFMPTAYRWQATAGLTVFFAVVASGNNLWGALRLPGLLWLGDITYSIYLLHGFLLWTVLQHFWPRRAASHWPVFLGSVIAIDVALILIASLVFIAIERPAVLLGKRHYRRFGPRRTMARET